MTFDPLDANAPEFLRYSLQQIYFPPIVNILPDDGAAVSPSWFGLGKRDITDRWRSWLSVLAMTEDDNEGVFGTPPPTGNFVRLAPAASLGQLSYTRTPETQAGFDASDTLTRSIVERDGLARHHLWSAPPNGSAPPNVQSAHPLSSCRIGDDPEISACDDRHELRGHPGIFVTDASAVPTSLCVNPSLTIAALAERASAFLLRSAPSYGVNVTTRVPPPGKTPGSRARRCQHPA
jgi:choline dehydrogenase-like flavoprotein